MIIIYILYNLTIYPIEFIIEIIFYFFNSIFNYDYALSLFLLSLFVSLISLPFYNVSELWAKKEREIQNIMKPDIEHINKNFKGDEKFLLTRACYKIYGYKTIYAFRGTLGLLIQIPFFLAAYNFIHNLSGLQLGSFLFIKDFSKPDGILNIGNISVNILPFIMTLFSLLAGLVYSKKLRFKESLPLYIVSLIFLVLLYNSPSGLVFYWTLNCLFSLIKNIFIEYKLYKTLVYKIKNKFDKKENFNNIYKIFICLSLYLIIIASIFDNTNNIVINKYFLVISGILVLLSILLNRQFIYFIKNKILTSKTLKNIINISTIIITIAFIILSILGNVERKGYLGIGSLIRDVEATYNYNMRVSYYDKTFRNNDIYGVIVNTNKLDSNIFSIEFEKYGSPFGIVKLNDDIKNIDKIEVYYKLFVKSIFLAIFILFITLFTIFNNIHKYILNIFNNIISDSFLEKRNLLIISSCLVISVLSGLFIPCQLIGSSPAEFEHPFNLILQNLSMSLGLFLFYPMFIYILFSEKIKNYLTLIFIFLSSIVLINAFIFVGNYGYITSDFIFDNAELLKASNKDIFFNIISIIIVFSTVLFVILKNKRILINIYFIILIVLIGISIYNIFNIIKEHNYIIYAEKEDTQTKNTQKIFKLSKTGKNIFVFFLDLGSSSYWHDIIEKHEKYKIGLDGFVFFPNNVSFSSHTLTVASLYGGYDYLPYEMSTNGNYNITNFHNEALLTIPNSLGNYGYESYILAPPFVNFNHRQKLDIFSNSFTHAKIEDMNLINYSLKNVLGKQIINNYNKDYFIKGFRFSILKLLPTFYRFIFYQDGNYLMNIEEQINKSHIDYSLLLNTKNLISLEDNGDYYNILHNMITHGPMFFDSNYLPKKNTEINLDTNDYNIYKDRNSIMHLYSNGASIECILSFIEFLKNNNIYDNTKIIIVSDHVHYFLNTSFIITNKSLDVAVPFNALLVYKDFNARGELKIDTNFMTIADTPYLVTKHIPNIKNPFNNKLITNDYKTNGAYILMPVNDLSKQFSNRYNFNVYYHVKDNIFDINNWKKFEINWKTKESKEIKDLNF